jgi:hypothetical protein
MTNLDNQISSLKMEVEANRFNAGRYQVPIHLDIAGLEEFLIGTSGNRLAEGNQLLQNLKKLRNLEQQNIHQVFTYNKPSKYGTFKLDFTIINGIQSPTPFEAEDLFNVWLKEQEAGIPVTPPVVTPPVVTPPVVTPPVVTPPVVTPPVVTPPVDDSINTNMVTQQVINFNIVNGRAVGSIKFVATNNFNPYYYGKPIFNIVQFKDPNGAKIITFVKENRLNFTETERDEVISYDEDMQGNTRATVESFVWSSPTTPSAFSNMFSIEISEAEPPKPIASGFMGAGAAGAIAGLVLLGFIIDHKVSKR